MRLFKDPILGFIEEQLADPEISVITYEARAQIRVKTRCDLVDGNPGSYMCLALDPKGLLESAQKLAGDSIRDDQAELRIGGTIVRINLKMTYRENPDAPVIQIIKSSASSLDDLSSFFQV